MADAELMNLRQKWYERAKMQTAESLPAFLKELSEHPHDYNTICYAVAAAAVGAAWAVERCPQGGITGFQGGAVMWEFMEAWNGVKAPARLLQFSDALFPQYDYKFNSISPETWRWLREEAQKKLDTEDTNLVSASVRNHWQSIRDGRVPFGLQVRND